MAVSRNGKDAARGRRGGGDVDGGETAVLGEKLLRFAEDAIYVAVAALLIVGAAVLLVDAGSELWHVLDGADTAVLGLLDRLLLVFVLVELIFAVRMTLQRREIVAEPFLIVGIIASIKEIILLSVELANVLEGKPTVDDHGEPMQFIVLIGTLGVLVLVLAGSAVLLRLKERQPVEGARNEEHPEPDEPGSRR